MDVGIMKHNCLQYEYEEISEEPEQAALKKTGRYTTGD
ncbi:hypothetical protein CsSME_00012214 [Camellia sinensis var. sinensis]